MKRVSVLLLALLVVFTGCRKKSQSLDVAVEDVCCPYAITHEDNGVVITLRDAEQKGIHWQVETIPQDVCQVTQEDTDDEYATRYRVTGSIEGVAQLTLTAMDPEEIATFALTVVLNVGPDGKTELSSHQYRQREDNTGTAEGLNYRWNVDVNGILNFSFLNDEDSWSVSGAEDGTCIFSNVLSTPSGCKFSAQANTPGQTTVLLVSETTERTIQVVIQVEKDGSLAIVSVQEQ